MKSKAKKGLLLFITLISACSLLFFPVISQNPEYHNFADKRALLKVPNFLNVFSNILFIFVGIYGSLNLFKNRKIYSELFEKILLYLLSLSIFFVGIASWFYHLNPANQTILMDRIFVALISVIFLGIILYDRVNKRLASVALFPLLILAVLSVVYWFYTENFGRGDLRLYIYVQFFPLLITPFLLILYPGGQIDNSLIIKIIVLFSCAKMVELYDEYIYIFFKEFISGHTLKHILAAWAGLYAVKMRRIK